MARKSSKTQPIPKKGVSFTGWAIFNWGVSHDIVFRTRKQAKEHCWKGNVTMKNNKHEAATCWNDVKDHMAVVKVKCTII